MNAPQPFDPDLSLRVALTIVHFVWQGLVLAALAAVACALLRRAVSETRHRVLLVALALMALCPFVTFALLRPAPHGPSQDAAPGSPAAVAAPLDRPGHTVAPVPQAAPALGENAEHHAPAGTTTSVEGAGSPAVEPAPVRHGWIDPQRLRPLAPWMTLAYVLGVAGMITRHLWAMRGARRLRRQADPVTDSSILRALSRQAQRLSLRRVPVVAWCRQTAAPAVVGVVRPMILLPVALAGGMSAAQIESILAHELAHVRRLDPLVNLLQGLVEALLFFHPAVWFVSRRLRLERENCCDDMVLSAGGAPLDYVKSLVRAAELGLPRDLSHPGAAALAAVGRPSQLRHRIVRLLQGEPAPQLRVSPGPLLAFALITSVGAGAWYHTARAEDAGRAPATTFTARLVDAHGRPLPNCWIFTDLEGMKRDNARSDADGRFSLKDIRPDQKHWIVRSQRTSRRAMFTVPPAAPAEPPTITVGYRESTIEGRVLDPAGTPVAGVKVWAHVTAPDGHVYRFRSWYETDAAGFYSIDDVPAGEGLGVRVSLSEESSAPGAGQAAGPAVALGGAIVYEMPDLVARNKVDPPARPIPPRVRYAARVVDEAGKGVEGALVSMRYERDHIGDVLTDARGRFTKLVPADADPVEFRLSHPEHIGYHFNDTATAPAAALKDGSAVLTMKRGLSIGGVVKDPSGKPVENALVLAGRLYSRTPSPEDEVIEDSTTFRTLKDGKFRIGGLPPGWRDITVSAAGFAPRIDRIEAGRGGAPADVVLEPGLTYTARVVDHTGGPVEGARFGVGEWVVGGVQHRAPNAVSVTDADGRFTLTGLPRQGRIEIDGGKRPFLSTGFWWSAEGGNRDTITLFPPAVIRGRAVDAETGAPVPRVKVVPVSGDPPKRTLFNASADGLPDGSFRLEIPNVVVPPDGTTFTARVEASGYYPQVTPPVRLGREDEPFVIKLRRGEALIGTVTDADGKPLAGASVTVVLPKQMASVTGVRIEDQLVNSPDPVVKTDPSGRFELPPIDAQGVLLVLHEKGYLLMPHPGAAPGQQIALVPWARVQGVVRADGKPLHGAQVALAHDGPDGLLAGCVRFNPSAVTHVDGKFTAEFVPSLPFKLTAYVPTPPGSADPYAPVAGPAVTPEPGAATTVEIGGAAGASVG